MRRRNLIRGTAAGAIGGMTGFRLLANETLGDPSKPVGDSRKVPTVEDYLRDMASREPQIYVCEVGQGKPLQGEIKDVAIITSSGSLRWASVLPRVLLLQLQADLDVTARSESSQLITFEGHPPIVLLHEKHAKQVGVAPSADRELIHELEHLDDNGGLRVYLGEGVLETVHHTVLNALRDVKCEGQCFRHGLGEVIMDDLRPYARIDGSKLKPMSVESDEGAYAVSSAISSMLSRYIRLSFLNLGPFETEKQMRLEQLKSTLMHISKPTLMHKAPGAVPFLNVWLTVKEEWDIRADVVTNTGSGWPSEEPSAIVSSVNAIVRNIARSTSKEALPSLAFQEDKSEFVLSS